MTRLDWIRTLAVGLLWCVGLGAAGQFAKLSVPFDLLQAAYPQAGAEIGWTLTLVSAIGAVLGVVGGLIVGRTRRVPVLVLSLVIGALMSAWQATLPAFPILLASRVVEGVSHLLIVVAGPTLVAQLCSDRYRAFGMTLWSTFFGVGFALVAWAGGPLIAAQGLPGLLAAHAGVMAGLAVICALVLPLARGEPPLTRTPVTLRTVVQMHRTTYGSAWISAPALGWLCYTLTFVSLLTVLPMQMPPGQRAFLVGLMPLVSIAVSLVMVPTLMARWSATQVTIAGFVLTGVVCLLGLAGLPVAVLAVAIFAGLGLVQGASFAMVPELVAAPQDRALANGALAQTGNIGNLLGTPILLGLLAISGPGGLILAVALTYFIGAAIHIVLQRRRSQG